MQDDPQDEFQGRDLFAGPIHGVLCSSRVIFLESVSIQLPVSLGGSVVSIRHLSVSFQDLIFSSVPREKQWTEISKELENPTSYDDGEVVNFKVLGFTGYVYRRLQKLEEFFAWSLLIAVLFPSVLTFMHLTRR